MSRLIITITAGAVSTLVGMAAMATHEGTQGSNMTASTAQQGVNPSQLQEQQAQQQFAIDQQDCATLKYQDHNAYDQCMHQATARRDQKATGGETKDRGIVDKFTTVVKDKLDDLGMGTGSDRQDKDVSGQQGTQQGYTQGQGGQGQPGFQQSAGAGQDQLQMHPFDPEIAEGGLTSGERYLLQHGRAQPELDALNFAYQQYAIQRQECDTLKNAVPQSYDQCVQQAHTAMSSRLSAAREAHKRF